MNCVMVSCISCILMAHMRWNDVRGVPRGPYMAGIPLDLRPLAGMEFTLGNWSHTVNLLFEADIMESSQSLIQSLHGQLASAKRNKAAIADAFNGLAIRLRPDRFFEALAGMVGAEENRFFRTLSFAYSGASHKYVPEFARDMVEAVEGAFQFLPALVLFGDRLTFTLGYIDDGRFGPAEQEEFCGYIRNEITALL